MFEVPPTYHEFEVGKGDKESMLIKGVIFASDNAGNKYVFNLIPYTEDYSVELPAVTVFELCIIPDINNDKAFASLAQLRLA